MKAHEKEKAEREAEVIRREQRDERLALAQQEQSTKVRLASLEIEAKIKLSAIVAESKNRSAENSLKLLGKRVQVEGLDVEDNPETLEQTSLNILSEEMLSNSISREFDNFVVAKILEGVSLKDRLGAESDSN